MIVCQESEKCFQRMLTINAGKLPQGKGIVEAIATSVLGTLHISLLDRFRSRTRTSTTTWKWRQNGVAYPYMGTTRHFHVVFDVRVLDLNLSISELVRELIALLY